MSMPKFPDTSCITREDAINQIISSIAMEELSLSHILNAEGEKLQYVLGTLPDVNSPEATIEDVLTVNVSVKELLEAAADNQQALSEKLKIALSADTPMGTQSGACGMIYDARTIPVALKYKENVPFTLSSSMIGTELVDNGIQVKQAGVYSIQYTVNMIAKENGNLLIGINGAPHIPSLVFIPSTGSNFASTVSGNLMLSLEKDDIVTLINISGDGVVMAGAAVSHTVGAIGNLSLHRVA